MAHHDAGVALALTFDYGQRAAKREIAAGRNVARALRVPWMSVALPWMARLLPRSLTTGRAPRVTRGRLDTQRHAAARARAVWVPNRNGVLLNIAAAYAEARGLRAVVAGFNREEASTFPDNSREYMKAATAAFRFSTNTHVRVVSPTALYDKTRIVSLGVTHDAPLRHVWSCYADGKKMCASCESCERLTRALRAADAPRRMWPRLLPRA